MQHQICKQNENFNAKGIAKLGCSTAQRSWPPWPINTEQKVKQPMLGPLIYIGIH